MSLWHVSTTWTTSYLNKSNYTTYHPPSVLEKHQIMKRVNSQFHTWPIPTLTAALIIGQGAWPDRKYGYIWKFAYGGNLICDISLKLLLISLCSYIRTTNVIKQRLNDRVEGVDLFLGKLLFFDCPPQRRDEVVDNDGLVQHVLHLV